MWLNDNHIAMWLNDNHVAEDHLKTNHRIDRTIMNASEKKKQRGFTSDEVHDFVAKNSTHWISRYFFYVFFHLLHHLCKGGYTSNFHCAAAMRQFPKKLHHHRKQKIANVATA